MNAQPDPLPTANAPLPPGKPAPQKPLPKIVWLFEAFITSVLALGIMQITNIDQSLGKALLILTVVCSLVAGIRLVRGMKSIETQVLQATILAFFFANVAVVGLIGCSKVGHISP